MGQFVNRGWEDKSIGLATYPDNFFGLGIIDPPYGIGEDGGKNHTRGKQTAFGGSKSKAKAKANDYKPYIGNDKSAPPPEYFELLNKKCKKWIVFGANHFLDNFPFPISSPCWIVWDKCNGDSDFADCELAMTNFKSAVRIARFRWNGMLQGDMQHKEIRIHPNQKPVALYQWILTKYAQKGDFILDTHVGSASSLIACESMGFNYMGFEKDQHYFGLAENRMKKGIQKQLIF